MADPKFPDTYPGYDENGFPLEYPEPRKKRPAPPPGATLDEEPDIPPGLTPIQDPKSNYHIRDNETKHKVSSKGKKDRSYDRELVVREGQPTETGQKTLQYKEITPSGDIYDLGTVPYAGH